MEEESLNEKADSNICIKIEENEQKTFTPNSIENNSIKCQQCNLELETLEEFIKHMKTEHLKQNGSNESANNLMVCPICDIAQPLKHINEHFLATKIRWKCKKCIKSMNLTFSTLQELQEHFLKIHTNIIYRCSICLEIFAQKDALLEHIFGHIIRNEQFKCISCELEFESKNAFDFHVQNIHLHSKKRNNGPKTNSKKAKKESTCKIDGITQNQHSNQPKGMKCIVCDFKFPNEFELDQHRLLAHCKVQKGNKCAICRHPMGGIDEFIEHCREHCNSINNEINCVICRQSMRGEMQMKMHGEYHLDLDEDKEEDEGMKIDNGNEQSAMELIECLTCKMEVEEGNYEKHLLLHLVNELSTDGIGKEEQSIIPPHCCGQCEKQFESADEMNLHILEHLSELIGQPSSSSKQPPENEGNNGRGGQIPKNGINSSGKRKCNQQTIRTMKCRICDKHFSSEDQMNAHSHTPI